jgi:hypothetical protein
MNKPEITISIDIESDGPVPGINSMLALGAAAFDQDRHMISTCYAKLKHLSGATPDPGTVEWWKTQPMAWEEVCKDQQNPKDAMESFVGWCSVLPPGRLVAAAWPAAFDFPFVNYYCHKFVGRNPLGFACLDIRSYIDGLVNHPSYYGLSEGQVTKLIGKVNKTELRPHIAVDDAIEQGRLLMLAREYAISAKE